jgi:hypothetical protein
MKSESNKWFGKCNSKTSLYFNGDAKLPKLSKFFFFLLLGSYHWTVLGYQWDNLTLASVWVCVFARERIDILMVTCHGCRFRLFTIFFFTRNIHISIKNVKFAIYFSVHHAPGLSVSSNFSKTRKFFLYIFS